MTMAGKKDVRELTGICGIYCGTCPKYLADRDQDVQEVSKMSQKDGVPVGEVRCDGCLSDQVYPTCVDCRHGFRRCSQEKGVTWCFQCPYFPCQRLHAFKDIHEVNGIWHHKRIIEHLRFMKDHGIEEWVKEQDKAGSCPSCGNMLYWYALQCPRCGNPVHHRPPPER